MNKENPRKCFICSDYLSKDLARIYRINMYQDSLPRPLYKIFKAAREEICKWNVCSTCKEEIVALGFKVVSAAELVEKTK